jgi:uncharacterized protein (TIGR03435 family)
MRHVVHLAILALAMPAAAFAQSPAPAFDAASIRANTQPGDPEVQETPGSLVMRKQSLFLLVQWAYDLAPAQIDGPSGLGQDRFDIVAKSSTPADETQLRLMLQTLLAERFGLKVHRDSRSMQVYAITLAKGGPKFQESPTEGTFALDRKNPVVLTAHHARMSDIAQGLSGELGRPVVDATGLKGRYEIRLDISPYLTQAGAGPNGGQVDVMAIMFTGLQEILGLKLESRKDNVDMLVIDHVNKTPTEN